MRRRTLIKLFAGFAAGLLPLAASAQQATRARWPAAAEKARRDYQKFSRPDEADREKYITRLIRIRERAASGKDDSWEPVDTELRKHPAPADPAKLSARLAGEWQSPRHDYLYRKDGTWTMLPAEQDGVQSTHGTWRIDGNQLIETVFTDPPMTSRHTIILISDKDFVFAHDDDVFYETRLKPARKR